MKLFQGKSWARRRRVASRAAVAGVVVGLFAGIVPSNAVVAGAGYTTFDKDLRGCIPDDANGVNCNNYTNKDKVYMSGGPVKAGLSDGAYYFAVLTPGSQNDGFVDGGEGNLSDDFDTVANRTFTVSNHGITSYTGSGQHTPHATGTSPNGKFIIGLAPFDDTDNQGGVYILAICQVGATKPSQCKYDAFRIRSPDGPGGGGNPFGVVSGQKYYDANADGDLDPGEVGIANWPINYVDGVSGTVLTDSDGTFSLTMLPDTYRFSEQPGVSPWMQTGNLENQSVGATLNPDKSYTAVVVAGSSISGLNFGNLCIGRGGGLTLGFWSNKNGQALIGADDLALLNALNLRDAAGAHFNPANYSAFRTWLLNANATNMAYMLSAQLAAMQLNVHNGFVTGSSLIYAPRSTSANANGFATVNEVMAEANNSLGANGNTVASGATRLYQEALKNALDTANNNLTFVQPSPSTCPAPPAPPA